MRDELKTVSAFLALNAGIIAFVTLWCVRGGIDVLGMFEFLAG